MIYFHSFRNLGLVIDIVQAQEYDGSDSGQDLMKQYLGGRSVAAPIMSRFTAMLQ